MTRAFIFNFAILAAGVSASQVRSAEPVDYIVLSSSAQNLAKASQLLQDDGNQIVRTMPQIDAIVVRSTNADFLRAVGQINDVQVIPDVYVEWTPPTVARRLTADDLTVLSEHDDPPVIDPDDALSPFQWGLTAIDAPLAWELGATGAGVKVAILDSGIIMNHVDIAANLNVEDSASFVPGEPFFNTLPGFSHGTHVAGIVAAPNNGRGTVGVAPDAEIIGVKVLSDETGGGSFSGIIAGIIYAADVDAHIINMSLGGVFGRRGEFFDPGTPEDASDDLRTTPFIADYLRTFNRATTYAHNRGTTIIASAGNFRIDGDQDQDLLVLPRDASHVIAVSATAPDGWALDFSTNLDVPASYTNSGTSVIDFAAPGGDFDLPGEDLCPILFINFPCWVYDMVVSLGSSDAGVDFWHWAAGTSMAAPHVAGVAALAIGQSNGDLTPAEVESILRAAADDLGKSGKDSDFGYGRVNAFYSSLLAAP